jgi:lauroyl/myristoyl acyltransferase
MGYQMAVLAKEQKHRRADEFLNKLRSSKGTQVIYKGMAVREILRSLKRGQIVGMLSDQDGGKKGVFVRFFGRMSSSPAGVATFAMRTDTPIFPVFIFREGLNRHRVEVEGPLNKPSSGTEEEQERIILQQFSEILEQKIRQAPDQWLWAHRRWAWRDRPPTQGAIAPLFGESLARLRRMKGVITTPRHQTVHHADSPEPRRQIHRHRGRFSPAHHVLCLRRR